MTAEQLITYILIPAGIARTVAESIGLKVPALTYAESEWILAFLAAAIGWFIYQYRAEIRAALEEEKAQIKASEEAKAAMLKKELDKQLKEDEFHYWWARHGAEVDAWRDEITGSGSDQEKSKEVTSPWG